MIHINILSMRSGNIKDFYMSDSGLTLKVDFIYSIGYKVMKLGVSYDENIY
jgi:hypothetical protein